MLSYGEVFLTVAAAVALFGPKDIPIIARAAGRYVGKAVGYAQSARGQLDGVMKRSQVDQVHKELQETMAQLEAIRYEIRNGMSISNPGPITRSVMKMGLKENPPGSSISTQTETVVVAAKNTPNLENGAPNKFSEALNGSLSDTKVVLEMQELQGGSLQSQMGTGGVSTAVSTSITTVAPSAFKPGPDGTFNTMPASTGRVAVAQRVVVKPIGLAPVASPQHSSPDPTTGVMQEITVLPVSAVSAGLLPPRTGKSSGASDLVLESVTERKVAFDTLEFFQQTDPPVRNY